MDSLFANMLSDAIERARKAKSLDEAREILDAVRIYESRRTKFIINWCLSYIGFDQIFLGYEKNGTPEYYPVFYDRTFHCQNKRAGSGVTRALSLFTALAKWEGGILALEHPEAGLDEKHVAPLTKLIVLLGKAETSADVPWFKDMIRWTKSGKASILPETMAKYLPKG